MTEKQARDDERAIFEALANRLGEHPHSRNQEQGMSGEYETFIHETNVEALAEWLMPTVLEAVARKHPEPVWEYGEMNAMGGVWPIKPDVSPELWASTPIRRRRQRIAPGPWVPVGEESERG